MSARRTLAAALLGQALALLIALTAVCSALLAQQGISAPTLQSSLNYALLGIVYTVLHVRAHGWRWRCRWWAYCLLALLDVEGNACLVLAYRYTSLTSVTLLDCFTIPMVVALSTALLGAAYHRRHFAGAGICIAGLVLLLVTDRSSSSGSGSSSNPLLGDGLVLLGASLYALCNVLQEWLLGDVPVEELLGTMGLFGCMWSALQGLPLELHTLLSARWSVAAALPFLGFGAAMFSFYSLVPYELKWGGAALLNISLLASDVWTALARYLWLGGFQGSSLLFFALSLSIVAAGIALFTAAGDIETQLGAGRSDGALPVAYHRVSAGGGGPGKIAKGPQEALEELRMQHQQLCEAPPVALPNPFDVPVARPGVGPAGGVGFMPLPAVDESWPSPQQGLGCSGGTPTAAAAAAAAAVAAGPVSPAMDEGTPRLSARGSPRLAPRGSLELEPPAGASDR